MKTIKQDWVNDYLSTQLIFTSGHPSNNKYLNLGDDDEIVFRFIELDGQFIYFATVVSTSDDAANNIEAAISDNRRFAQYFDVFPNFFILLIKDDEEFYAIIRDHKAMRINLLSFFQNFIPTIGENIGTFKAVNKSVNDIFQSWTRINLSKYAVISDLDAICFVDGSPILFELKRVEESIEEWLPYMDDASIYRRQLTIAKRFGGKFRLIAYNAYDEEGRVAFFTKVNVSKERITAIKLILPKEYVLLKKDVDWQSFRDVTSISSDRRRVKSMI